MILTGRVAVVTGASQGIGRACALKLAKCGASVALLARSREKLEETAREIQNISHPNSDSDHGGAGVPARADSSDRGGTGVHARTYVAVADIENEDQIKAAFKSIIAELGKIDILVNNAGITRDQLVMRMKRADWDSVLNTNLTSAYVCTQQAISSMLKQRWGRIINITSIFGQMGQAGQANYAASKAGLIGLTMAIAREVGSRNITCNAVAPGFIETAMTAELPEELKENAVKMIPLGRIGSTGDVANCVAFLASEEAGYITGHVLNVNGGMLMG
jgi:3-oxoacyl-[acyl-carrier protein] reductase